MVILNIDHPDIEDFIGCKSKEEKKAHALIDAGYDASLDGEAYSSVFFQNANNSVRVFSVHGSRRGRRGVEHALGRDRPSQ